MKPHILIISLVFIISVNATSQESTDRLFKNLGKAFDQEEWKSASSCAKELMTSVIDSVRSAQVRYAYLVALAAEVTIESKSFDELENEANKFIGTTISTLIYKVSDKKNDASFNFITMKPEEPKKAHISVSNKQGVNIFCFVDIFFDDALKATTYADQWASCTGTLTNVEVHRSSLMIWIMKLTIEHATIKTW
jgi:hypothetical protein